MAILDEIDSGLDIDALRDVATAVNGLKTPERSVLMVTHYRVSEDHGSNPQSTPQGEEVHTV
jgi:Fe-S cluster assembly ATPase SufC